MAALPLLQGPGTLNAGGSIDPEVRGASYDPEGGALRGGQGSPGAGGALKVASSGGPLGAALYGAPSPAHGLGGSSSCGNDGGASLVRMIDRDRRDSEFVCVMATRSNSS